MLNFLCCFLFFFQSKIITVVDFETNKAIPFVSFMGLTDHKGGYANENGRIYFDGNINQSFVISCTGYSPDTVRFEVDTIRLKPLSIILPTVEIRASKNKDNTREIGFFKKNSWSSFAAQAKYEFYTYIANPDTNVVWQITSIKLAVRGHRKKNFESFKIRPHLKGVLKHRPNLDLLKNDITADVYEGDKSITIPLSEPLILPKDGCFVGFEPIGFSIKANEFIPYSDYPQNPSIENVSISIPMVKSTSKSLWRNKNGKSWYGSPFESDYVFAFALEVTY